MKKAITAYEKAIELNPGDTCRSLFHLGYNYGERGDYEKAQWHTRKPLN